MFLIRNQSPMNCKRKILNSIRIKTNFLDSDRKYLISIIIDLHSMSNLKKFHNILRYDFKSIIK